MMQSGESTKLGMGCVTELCITVNVFLSCPPSNLVELCNGAPLDNVATLPRTVFEDSLPPWTVRKAFSVRGFARLSEDLLHTAECAPKESVQTAGLGPVVDFLTRLADTVQDLRKADLSQRRHP
eukprot:5903062-Amphidinium_carterae.2